jgi:hypothetical protein
MVFAVSSNCAPKCETYTGFYLVFFCAEIDDELEKVEKDVTEKESSLEKTRVS